MAATADDETPTEVEVLLEIYNQLKWIRRTMNAIVILFILAAILLPQLPG
jgi:hypothetical protein